MAVAFVLESPTPPSVGTAKSRAAAGWQNIVNAFIRGSQEYKIIAHHEIGRPGIIFRDTGKWISQVEKSAWHPGVDVELQSCAWADSDYCNR